MTKQNQVPDWQAAQRLLDALNTTTDMTDDEARKLLPGLIEAERAGEDVDSNPTYAQLLCYLDHSPETMALYTQLSCDLEDLLGEADTLPNPDVHLPFFFEAEKTEEALPFLTIVCESDHAILHIFEGLIRRFELILEMPNLDPILSLLHPEDFCEGWPEKLFAGLLTELPGTPLVSVALKVFAGPAEVFIAISEAMAVSHWEVQLTVGEIVFTALTDDQGVATFGGLTIDDLQTVSQVRLTCAEVL